MIVSIKLLRNIGQFDSVSAASLPLARLNLIYAENGRGKTTLAAILRSLATGDSIPIAERKRLSAVHPPEVIIECLGGSASIASFRNNAWSRTLSDLVVFDDHFIDSNVYSGLVVTSDHRQNLHELILGAQGVTLSKELQELASKIEQHNIEIRSKAALIPESIRGAYSIDEFCGLQNRDNLDEEIKTAERDLEAIKQQQEIQRTDFLPEIRLPIFDSSAITSVLSEGIESLDKNALEKLKRHFSTIGGNGEEWVSAGFTRLSISDSVDTSTTCPFCCQTLSESPVLDHYRAYFSDEYQNLKKRISGFQSDLARIHGGDAQAAFERSVRALNEKQRFWAQFVDLPAFDINLLAVSQEWRKAREGVLDAFKLKQASPLEPIFLTSETLESIRSYENLRIEMEHINQRLQATRDSIGLVKEKSKGGDYSSVVSDLRELNAVKARYSADIVTKCLDYQTAKSAKSVTEKERDSAQARLNQYRTSVFPGFQVAINQYLERFYAGFRLDSVTSTHTRGGPTCTYSVVVNETAIPVAGGKDIAGKPSFRTTLSAGDRNTLALAFFFATLDHDTNLSSKVVVIDDPVSSLDAHRSLTTVQELRRLCSRVAQMIVLSHSKPFLCHIWDKCDQSTTVAITVARDTQGSTLREWIVLDDMITEHDRLHGLLRNFHANDLNAREVAQAIRKVLEAFCRVAYPEVFKPGSLLGPFRSICEQRLGTSQQILSQNDINELRDITEYANLFHHDTNPAYQTECINDGQLLGFVTRTLRFTRRI